MKVHQILLAVLLIHVILLVPTGIARKGKRKIQRNTQASAPSGTPPKMLPTEKGWAHGDTTTSVQDIYATATALSQRGEYMLAAEGFEQALRIMPNNPVFRVDLARNAHRVRKKAEAAQDGEEVDPEASENPTMIVGQHKE